MTDKKIIELPPGIPEEQPGPAQPDPNRRTCETCACFLAVADPNNVSVKAAFCRRNEPGNRDTRTRVPGPQGGMVEGIMRNVEQRMTHKDAVCFDGWRPIGTLPGQNWQLNPRN